MLMVAVLAEKQDTVPLVGVAGFGLAHDAAAASQSQTPARELELDVLVGVELVADLGKTPGQRDVEHQTLAFLLSLPDGDGHLEQFGKMVARLRVPPPRPG